MALIREGVLAGGCPYLALGHGPPLVVFPGLTAEPGNPQGLGRQGQLRPILPLANYFTVYVINRRPGLRPGTTIKDLADHVAEAINDTFAGPVDVEGISTGGSIAQQFAIDHPALVHRLVLVATAVRLSPAGRQAQRDQAAFLAAGEPRQAWAAIGPVLAGSQLGGRAMARFMWLLAPALTPADPSDMITTIMAEDAFDVSATAHRIIAPTLIIAGGRDRVYSPELFRETADRIPHARLRLYLHQGHAAVINYEPATRHILHFLTDDYRWGATMVNSAIRTA